MPKYANRAAVHAPIAQLLWVVLDMEAFELDELLEPKFAQCHPFS